MVIRVSVIVATYNRATALRSLLLALSRQDLPPDDFEVVVVDDGSTDTTQTVLRQFQAPFRMSCLQQSNQGPGAARNAGIRTAEGEVILTLDDDVEPAPDLLRRHLEAHTGDQPVAATGVFARSPERLSGWCEWEFSGLERQYSAMIRGEFEPTPRQFWTANSSAPRWAYIKAGLFDPAFRRTEDVELAYRLEELGVQFRFLPDAVIRHRPNRSFAAWQQMASQYGHYDIVMWRDKGREHILSNIGEEFTFKRSKWLQRLARLVIGRRPLAHATVFATGRSANLLSAVRVGAAARPMYSVAFNLLYWQGVADELGGRQAFLDGLDVWKQPASPRNDNSWHPDGGSRL